MISITSNCPGLAITMKIWENRPPLKNGPIRIIWGNWFAPKPPCEGTGPPSGGFAWHGSPRIKTLDQFKWSFPKKINRLQVQTLFRLRFIKNKGNIIFLGGVGLGKTHLATALGYHACLKGHTVLFSTAIDAVNTLTSAQKAGGLKPALKKYAKPSLLVLDELGYLPIDKTGADLLFQIISKRYENGSLIITTNRAFKDWPEIFNNDSTLTSALLDRLLHHTETVVIEGSSYRMKDVIEN